MKYSRKYAFAPAAWVCLADLLALMISVAAGIFLRRMIGPPYLPSFEEPLGDFIISHLDGWIYFCGAILLVNYIVGSYGIHVVVSRFNLLVNWIFSLFAALLVVSVTSYAWVELLVGRGVFACVAAVYAFLSLAFKLFFYRRLLQSDMFVCNTMVMGTGLLAAKAKRVLENRHIVPRHRICAYVEIGGDRRCGSADNDAVPVVVCSPENLENTVREYSCDMLVVCAEDRDDAKPYYAALRRVRWSGVEVIDWLSLSEKFSGRVPLDQVDETWLLDASMAPSIEVVRRLKRLMDIGVSIFGLLVFAPIALVVAFLVKISDPRGRIIYCQTRSGQFGRIFMMYKFRTMHEGAEDEVGPVWSSRNDPRVTYVGGMLRRFRLDEIPQIVNILKGDMSIVGPRPERPEIVEELEKTIQFYRERENVPPGLTGWAQVQYPYVDTVGEVARKLEYDLYYVKNMSIRLDLQIILQTLRIVALGKEREI